MNLPLPAALGLVLALPLLAAAGDWPAWRGPLANGVAPDARPPLSWSETDGVRWKIALPGSGTATPVVWGDQVFVLAAIPVAAKAAAAQAKPAETPPAEPGRRGRGPRGGMSEAPTEEQHFAVLSYDRATGKERWRRVVRTQLPHEGHHRDHGFASASPVTDGEVLVAHFGSYGTYALDMAGKPLWETDLGDMRTRNGFGEGSSPALSGDTVVVLWDHEGADFIVALDRRTGKRLWRRERDEPTGWCTPLVVEHAGRRQVVVNATGRVRSYDLATGEPLWECGGQTANAIPSAVAGHGRVYVASGFRGAACMAIALGRTGDLTGTDAVLWHVSKATPYVPSPLLLDDTLYLVSGNNAMLSAVDAGTGRLLYESERIAGLNGVYASPAAAGGRIYLVGRDGGVAVIRPGPRPEILSLNRLAEGIDASPAFAGDALFLRGHKHLYCLAGAH